MLFNKIAIVGTGLIGGSVALAVKQRKLAREVVGVSRKRENISRALKMGAIDHGSCSMDVIAGADLVVLALPIKVMLEKASLIAEHIQPGSIVTDAGSTKKEIVDRLSNIFPLFVGSHPLSGSEKRGMTHADGGLFRDSICVITPSAKTHKGALRKVNMFWKAVGARVVTMDPAVHDRVLSFVSHLPHVAAFALMNAIPGKFIEFAPPSLREATRIASSDEELWADIIFSNRRNVLKAMKGFQIELSRIHAAVSDNNRRKLCSIFNAAKRKRGKII